MGTEPNVQDQALDVRTLGLGDRAAVQPGESHADDPFRDLSTLRLSQDFAATTGVKKVLLSLPVRKPMRHEFIQVHPDKAFQFDTVVLEEKEEGETYMVDRPLWQELAGEVVPKRLYTAINRQGNVLLWPVRLADADERLDPWNRSAHAAAEIAMSQWIRVASNRSLGAYDVFVAAGQLDQPTWPALDFQDMLRLAFQDKFIRNGDHPVLRRLRGVI